ncbi:MAG: AEC family transporter [Clostridia bacterium]|nr:AEC family transporter [Clostridia bacterium]
MADNLILSLKTVLPMVILTGVGIFLGKIKLFGEAFYAGADKFVFKVSLPCMIFLQVAGCELSEGTSYFRLTLFIVLAIVGFAALYSGISVAAIKQMRQRGAAVQGMFRSNVAILGTVLMENMFRDGAMKTAALAAYAVVMPFVVLIYNILAVSVLAVFMPGEDENGDANRRFGAKDFGRALLETVKNPLIIAVAAGLPFMFFGIRLPEIADKSLGYLSQCTTGLSLISLGAGFSFKSLAGNIKLAAVITAVKTVFQPAAGVALACLFGFRGAELAVAFIIFGTPAAVSSYIMAKNMKSDHELAGQVMLLTTIFSVFTLFAGSFILRTLGLI